MEKENPQIEKFAADTILQKGVSVKIKAPFLVRIFRKTIKVKITSPYEGTMHRVARYYLKTGLTTEKLEGLTIEKAVELHAEHGKTISKSVAVAILNGYFSGMLFTRILAWYLRWHMTSLEMFTIVNVLLIYGGVSDFMNTTKSVRKMTITKPRKGQPNQGS